MTRSVLLLLFGIIVTGFIIEALRIRVTSPPWEVWSFGGWMLAKAFAGLDPEQVELLHKSIWWTHTFLSLGFIAYIPYSRLLHIITTSANHFLVSLKPAGHVEPIRDFETADTFGVGRLEEFTKKQIFDSDACTRCGRCQDGCPAYLSGKPLSPKKVIQDLKTYWLEQAPAAVAAKRAALGEAGPGETGRQEYHFQGPRPHRCRGRPQKERDGDLGGAGRKSAGRRGDRSSRTLGLYKLSVLHGELLGLDRTRTQDYRDAAV